MTAHDRPPRPVVIGPERAVASPALFDTLVAPLPAFLAARRWFAGKARSITATTLEDVAMFRDDGAAAAPPIPGDAGVSSAPRADVALALVRVDYTRGEAERYALLLGLVDTPGSLPLIAPAAADRGAIVEAAGAPFAVRALVAGFTDSGRTIPTARGGSLRYDDVPAGVLTPAELAPDGIRPLAAEQSNSSIRIGERLLLKLFRVIADGESPEVEMSRFLTAAGFRATAALRGSLTYLPSGGGERTIAVLQEWRANEGDGWSWVVATLRVLVPEAPSDVIAGERPASREASGDAGTAILERAARELGRTTAELHATLASARANPAFAAESVTAADAAAWATAVRERADRLWPRLTDAGPSLDEAARALVVQLGEVRARVAARASPPRVDGGGAFVKIRIHGDYHLGQTLRVPDGFLVIDFEGEPARPLAERRTKHCALKDVAGMLRSFSYAVGVAGVDTEPLLRDAFLTGYFESAGRAAFLPAHPDARRAWIDLFELEKALYEVEYELDHRPEWTHLPLRGVARILAGDG